MAQRKLGLTGLLLTGLFADGACGGSPMHGPVVRTVQAPASPAPATPASPADHFALPDGPRDDEHVVLSARPLRLDAWEKARKAKVDGVRASSCGAYTSRVPAQPAPQDFATALAETDPARRDASLAALETALARSSDLLAGSRLADVARALRADLAPLECADALADPYLAATPPTTGDAVHVLVGLSLASKLSRTATSLPLMTGARDKAKVLEYVKGPLRTWLVDQATAIEALSAGAAGLAGYGRGIAAIEAGTADLRLVDKMRSAPLPTSWDAELKSVYEAALDEALEPRKARGRDATLVGLADFAHVGSLNDTRVERARVLLARLYGGRRVDGLDALLLPKWDLPEPEGPLAAVATFWIDAGLAGTARSMPRSMASDPRALARGVPQGMRAFFRAHGDGAASDLRSSYARARLEMGRLYWRRVDFVEAAYAAKASASPDDRLVLALSIALAKGPNGVRDLMGAPSPGALSLAHTEALDAIAAEGGPLAGFAAFDAAHLRSLCAPDGPSAAPHLRDVATRFTKAATLLGDPEHKARALGRAAEAEAAAAAAGKSAAP